MKNRQGVWGAALLWAGLVGCGSQQSLVVEAPLSGAAEVPAVATAATGSVRSTLRGRELEVSASFANLSSDLLEVNGTPAHIHEALADENGPIIFNLSVSSSDLRNGSIADTIELTEDQARAFRTGLYYVNIHTVNNPGGELRAQLSLAQPIRSVFEAPMSGNNEVPPVTTGASGNIRVELLGDVLTLTGSFQGLESDLLDINGSPAHIHQGAVGQNGPIVFNVAVVPDASNRAGTFSLAVSLTDSERSALVAGLYYLNVHTTGNPGGELRVQLFSNGTITQ